MRELPAFAQGESQSSDAPPPRRRVTCSWCSEGITLQFPGDEKKYCVACGHQGAKAQDKCECATCVTARLAQRGIEVPTGIRPAAPGDHCPTCGQKVRRKKQ